MRARDLGRCAGVLGPALLAACSPPGWRDPAKSRNPDPTPAIASLRPARAPKPAERTTTDPPPPLVVWAPGLIGRPLAAAFPKTAGCLGNTDGVQMRFQGAQKATEIAGWGWDAQARAPVARVVLLDDAGRIVGAGDGGVVRRDVPRALPQIASLTTGWRALTARASGVVEAYGVLADGRTVCKLGRMELPP